VILLFYQVPSLVSVFPWVVGPMMEQLLRGWEGGDATNDWRKPGGLGAGLHSRVEMIMRRNKR